MRPVLIITVAVLLACVAYSHQQDMPAVFQDDGGSMLNDGRLVREAHSAYGSIRHKRQDNTPAPKPTEPPKGNFDEIDNSGFPIGSR